MVLSILFRVRSSVCRLSLAHAASFWLLLLVAAVPTCAESPDDSTRAVTALHVDQPPRIDGHLSEPAWQKAEVAGDFFRAQQNRGMPARLRTEAFVLLRRGGDLCRLPLLGAGYDRTPRNSGRRDTRIWGDDAVESFSIPITTTAMRTSSASTRSQRRWTSALATRVPLLCWDASWEAEVQKYTDHWTAEFAIPLAELQYDKEGTTWGVNFWGLTPSIRNPILGPTQAATLAASPNSVSCEGLQLTTGTSETGRLAFLPYASYRALEDRPDDGDAGIDLIYQPSASLIGNLTVFPDFSQLESDPTADQRQRRTRAVSARTPAVLSRWSGTVRSAPAPVLHAPSAGNRFGASRAREKWAATLGPR